jgi:hypothetical protein
MTTLTMEMPEKVFTLPSRNFIVAFVTHSVEKEPL